VVHGTHKATTATLTALIASAVLTIGAVLSAATGTSVALTATLTLALALLALLALILIVLRVSAKTAFTTPLLTRALALVLLRLVGSIIHSVIT
jgi:hypothetical protein